MVARLVVAQLERVQSSYITPIFKEVGRMGKTGCSSAWTERLIWGQKVGGSNPLTQTISKQEVGYEDNDKNSERANRFR